MPLFMDQGLARRLERTEATIGVAYVDVRRRLEPGLGSTWRDIGGAYAFFDGADSILTQSFGLGMYSPAAESIAELEAFFEERAAAPQHEVSLLAGVDAQALLVERGYRPIETSNVLVQPIAEAALPPPAAELRVRACRGAAAGAGAGACGDEAAWIETAVAGWSDTPEVGGVIRSIARAALHNPLFANFIVERRGEPIATASLAVAEGVAVFAGASTIPSGRGLGAQTAVLAARLAEAQRRGCELAMIVAAPGSASQRNAERAGFRVAYSRTKWARRPTA